MHTFLARAMLGAFLLVASTTAVQATVRLSETGSTLLFPIVTIWIKDYRPAHPEVRIEPAATGSGTGIRAAIRGLAQIGASDAYLSDDQISRNGVINIPLAVSAQEIVYNVPELKGGPPLKLSGPLLAGIYDGSIPYWDDAKIAALNADCRCRIISSCRCAAATHRATRCSSRSTSRYRRPVGTAPYTSGPMSTGRRIEKIWKATGTTA